MGDDLDMERRVTTVENWQTNHDKVCATRWGILIRLIGWGGAVAVSAIIGIAGWGMNRLYDAQQQQNAAIQQLMAKR